MPRKTNKTSHVLNLITTGASSGPETEDELETGASEASSDGSERGTNPPAMSGGEMAAQNGQGGQSPAMSGETGQAAANAPVMSAQTTPNPSAVAGQAGPSGQSPANASGMSAQSAPNIPAVSASGASSTGSPSAITEAAAVAAVASAAAAASSAAAAASSAAAAASASIPPSASASVSPAASTPEASAVSSPESSAAPTPEASVAPTPEASAVSSPESSAEPTPESSAMPTPEPSAEPAGEPPASDHAEDRAAVQKLVSSGDKTVVVVDKTSQNDKISNQILDRLTDQLAEEEQQKKPQETYRMINVMEQIVRRMRLKYYMEQYDVCMCSRCQADVLALILTRLPAKYVVVDGSSTAPIIGYYESKFRVRIFTEIIKACIDVKEKPRHDRNIPYEES